MQKTSELHNNEGIVGVIGLFMTCENEVEAECLSQILGDEICCIVTKTRQDKLTISVYFFQIVFNFLTGKVSNINLTHHIFG